MFKKWELEKVGPVECILDHNKIFTIINRIENVEHKGSKIVDAGIEIRVDVTNGSECLRSFIGNGNDVRKRVISWLFSKCDCICVISTEHASYIGYEIARAMIDENYVQD